MDASTLRERNRLRLLAMGALLPFASLCDAVSAASPDATPLRFGTTAVFLDNQIAMLGTWQRYLARQMGRQVHFVQRGNYREIVDLLLSDRIDAAWLCGYPYVSYESRLTLAAVPVYQGQPLYRSYLIVPASDKRTQHIKDLDGGVFAFSDALSNSGYLVPRVELARLRTTPEAFFRRSFFTYAHRKVVEAVQIGLATGGSVDGYVWDTLQAQQPKATAGVRVAWKSAAYGFPPIVARRSASPDRIAELTNALQAMPKSTDGRQLLAQLNVDGFVPGEPTLFNGIRQLIRDAGTVDLPRPRT